MPCGDSGQAECGWLLKMVELIRGDNQWDFNRTFRVSSIVHVAWRHVNSHGIFFDVLEYGAIGGKVSSSSRRAEKGVGGVVLLFK